MPEKGEETKLIQGLIFSHLEFTKASKQKLPSVKLRRQRDKFRDELEELLGEELTEEIQLVLNDCEELISWELELKNRLENKTLLIEGQKQILQITNGDEEKALIQKHETIQQKEQEQLREEVFANNYLRNQLSKVEELVEKQPQTSTKETGLTTRLKRILSIPSEASPSKEIRLENQSEIEDIENQQSQILHNPPKST